MMPEKADSIVNTEELDPQTSLRVCNADMAGQRIGNVAERTGVSAPTIRYYESVGLLRPITAIGVRLSSPLSLARLSAAPRFRGRWPARHGVALLTLKHLAFGCQPIIDVRSWSATAVAISLIGAPRDLLLQLLALVVGG